MLHRERVGEAVAVVEGGRVPAFAVVLVRFGRRAGALRRDRFDDDPAAVQQVTHRCLAIAAVGDDQRFGHGRRGDQALVGRQHRRNAAFRVILRQRDRDQGGGVDDDHAGRP